MSETLSVVPRRVRFARRLMWYGLALLGFAVALAWYGLLIWAIHAAGLLASHLLL